MPFFCIHCRAEIDSKYKACPFCGEPITEFLRRYLDTPIDGKYQILSRLGVGGMGEVYKVLHIHLNSIRVIKLMRSSIAGDRGAHDRFLREARLATRIQHPNVAALFDFSTLDEGSRYMVWEYIEGTNLHEMIDARGPLSPRYAAKLAVQTLHGLDAIHRAGIVHRDISPENLMIANGESDETVKIIDLGIAKQWTDDQDRQTKTGMFVGKWKYCSPEHLGLLQEGERIDGRADIYSFGIVLYEMLTGLPPFQADTPHAYLMMHSTESPRPLRDVNPTVSAAPDLEALIFRALEKDRTARFRTAREFAHEIEKLIPHLDDTAGSPAPAKMAEVTAEPTRIRARDGEDAIEVDMNAPTVQTQAAGEVSVLDMPEPPRRKSAVPLAATFAIVLAIAIGAASMLRNHAQPAPQQPPAPRKVESSVVALAPGHLGINAYPWATVTSIRDMRTGRNVIRDAPLVTPAPVELAPGRYEITLSNPEFSQAIVKTVEIKSGEDQVLHVPFADAASLTIPHLTDSAQ